MKKTNKQTSKQTKQKTKTKQTNKQTKNSAKSSLFLFIISYMLVHFYLQTFVGEKCPNKQNTKSSVMQVRELQKEQCLEENQVVCNSTRFHHGPIYI